MGWLFLCRRRVSRRRGRRGSSGVRRCIIVLVVRVFDCLCVCCYCVSIKVV